MMHEALMAGSMQAASPDQQGRPNPWPRAPSKHHAWAAVQAKNQVGNQTTTCSDDQEGEEGPWWVPLAFVTRDAPHNLIWAPFHTCTTGTPFLSHPWGFFVFFFFFFFFSDVSCPAVQRHGPGPLPHLHCWHTCHPLAQSC